jgi:hypothetical protein
MTWFSCLLGSVSLAHGAPGSIDAAGRLTAVGWTPSARGGGVDLGAVAQVAGGDRVRLALGPRLTLERTAMLGTPVAALASAEVLGRPSRHFWIDGRLVAGVETTWLPAGWTVEGGALVPATPRPTGPAARVGLAVGLGPSLPAGGMTLRPHVRYEQSVILGFAPDAGVPVMTRATVAVGVAFDLPSRSPR